MSARICLYGGPLFDGEWLLEQGSVVFTAGEVLAVSEGDPTERADQYINVQGRLIMPGLIDLHSDALEKCIEMRPGIFFDPHFALLNMDRRLAACGITTIYHAISFSDNEFGLRSSREAENLVRMIHQFSRSPSALVRNLVHLRFEIANISASSIVEGLIDDRLVHIFSLMDHTPGQGQFKTLESYIAYYTGVYKITRQELLTQVQQKIARKEKGMDHLVALAEKARNFRVPILSHDDDTVEKVSFVHALGVTATEFPVSMEAVQAAKRFNMQVFMGAPNLIRDRSSSGHIRASDVLDKGMCDATLSDYYPECQLQVPFIAAQRDIMNLESGLKLVTSWPGDYLDPERKTGRLTPGTNADIIVVDLSKPWSRVVQTWVSGTCVLKTHVNQQFVGDANKLMPVFERR